MLLPSPAYIVTYTISISSHLLLVVSVSSYVSADWLRLGAPSFSGFFIRPYYLSFSWWCLYPLVCPGRVHLWWFCPWPVRPACLAARHHPSPTLGPIPGVG